MNRWILASSFVTLAALGSSLLLFFGFQEHLIEQVPVHWNLHMEPDRFVAREDVFWHLMLFPGLMAMLTGMTWLLPRISPRSFDVNRFGPTFGYAMFLVIVLFAYLYGMVLCIAFGVELPAMDRLFVAGFFLFFALLGNIMGRVQRNFWLGVRTPWTLASDAVWERTHRLAAWLWLAAGLIGFVAVLSGLAFWICFSFLIAAALIPVVYSFLIWRRLRQQGHLD